MPDRRQPLPTTPTEVPPPGRPSVAPDRRDTPTAPGTEPAPRPGTPATQPPGPETGTPTPTIPEPPAPWLKERPDRKRGTGEPGRRREDENGPRGQRKD